MSTPGVSVGVAQSQGPTAQDQGRGEPEPKREGNVARLFLQNLAEVLAAKEPNTWYVVMRGGGRP